MSELFKYKLQDKNLGITTAKSKEGNYKGITKHSLPANKEWFNSIYAYNNNYIKLLPATDNVVVNLIRAYFNMYNKKLNSKLKIRYINNKKRKLSSRKIWITRPELKHTSDKVIINLFIYDRNNKFFIAKIKKVLNTFIKNKIKNIFKILSIIKSDIYNNMWNYIINFYKKNSEQYIRAINKENNDILSASNNIKNNIIFKNIENIIKKSFIRKTLKKEIYIMFYKQIMLFNNLKTKNILIFPLIKLLAKIYNKKVVFNIIRLKYYFLNSDILGQIIVSKTKNRNNRNMKVLSASIRNIETPKFNTKLVLRESTNFVSWQNYIIKNEFFTIDGQNKDKLNETLKSFYDINNKSCVLNTLKYKTVNGIKLQASGRLTRRFTAQRSVFNYKYLGSIKDINSSYKGLSSTIVRGNLKSNIQFTKLTSKTRIGTFGLKGWIGSI